MKMIRKKSLCQEGEEHGTINTWNELVLSCLSIQTLKKYEIEVTHDGTMEVKRSKLNTLSQEYKMIRMQPKNQFLTCTKDSHT